MRDLPKPILEFAEKVMWPILVACFGAHCDL